MTISSTFDRQKPFEGRRQEDRRVERVGKLEGALRLQRDKLTEQLRDGYEQSAQWTQNKINRIEAELAELT